MTRPAHARPNGPTGEPEAFRDDVLLDAARSGDAEALGALRERYRGTALAVARARTGSAEEAENVSAAALGRIEQVVGEGGGPRAFLGAFVVWMVGREVDGGTRPVALPDDPAVPASLLRVFSGLPAEWQAFLWHTEILGHSARRAASARGFGSVAAAGLHRDAFRGLRGLYDQASADRAAGPDCAEFSGELAHFVRGTRGQRSRWDVKEHLDGCARCTAEYLGRQDIGTGLRTWTLPVLAGLPLWGTEALELANLIAGADTGAGAAGAAGVGAGATAAAASGARAGEAAGGSPWWGRSAKVLLGAGALATAVAVAAVGVSGGGDPVPVADSLVVERAPRTAQDLEDQDRGGAADGADRTDDDASSATDLEQGSARSGESADGPSLADGPAGGLGGGASSEAALVLADADDDLVVTADAGGASGGVAGASGDVTRASGGGGAVRSEAAAERTAPDRSGARAAAAKAPTTASTGGNARESSSGSSTPTPSERTAEAPATAPTTAPMTASSPAPATSTPSPVPSVQSSQPAVDAGSTPLKAPVAPALTTAPTTAPEHTGTTRGAARQHTPPVTGASGDRGVHGGSWHREQSGNDGWKGHERDGRGWGRDRDRGHEGWTGHHGDGGDRSDRGARGDRGDGGHRGERGDRGGNHERR